MLDTVRKLMETNISAAEISRQTGVADSIIKRLRLGKQDYETMRYYNLKKLYDYQLYLEEQKVNDYTYEQYVSNLKKIEDIENVEEKYEKLLEINSDLAIKLRDILKSLGISKDSDITNLGEKEEQALKEASTEQLYKYIDLLIKTGK
ncbi:hypothetical protein [Staphylococcus shinii]|uniref:hypothetical protein n=1 Tax=Staphylococcus shinii TaxID=2912228 RepID=UPI003EE8D7EA